MGKTQNPKLVKTYQKDTKIDKQKLFHEFIPLVKKIAGRLSLRLPPDIDQDDLIQVGMLGLLESIDRYDPLEDVAFKTYAEYRIRGSMIDELRARDWIPRSVRRSASKLEKANLELRKKGIERPSYAELAKEMEMELEEFENFLTRNKSMPLLSLDSLGKKDNSDSMDVLEVIINPNEILSDESLIKKELVEKLANAIAKLPERAQIILALAYQEEMNLKEIAQVLNLTEARICQIRTNSIGFLRSELKSSSEN